MKKVFPNLMIASIFFGVLSSSANAAAIISNGTIQLGVDNLGQLNVPGGSPSPVSGTSYVGLRYLPTGNEATSHGCLCEGWGVADAVLGVTGYANNALGTFGLTLDSFISDATKATSVVTAGGIFKVTHDFMPSVVDELYEVKVTIENISGATTSDVRYRRTFDWDIEPTTFSEFVTIGGTATASNVLLATNNGFESSNPLSSNNPLLAGGVGDFTDIGPTDHGANFDFGFGSLAAGASKSFSIFYGGAATETDAFAALAAVGAEVYSFGQPSNDPNGLGLVDSSGNPTNTFIFAFKGVGGVSVGDPKTTPEPASVLGLLAIGGLGFLGKKKQLV